MRPFENLGIVLLFHTGFLFFAGLEIFRDFVIMERNVFLYPMLLNFSSGSSILKQTQKPS